MLINYCRYLEQNDLEQNIDTYENFLKNDNPNKWVEVQECDFLLDKLDIDYLTINNIASTDLDILN